MEAEGAGAITVEAAEDHAAEAVEARTAVEEVPTEAEARTEADLTDTKFFNDKPAPKLGRAFFWYAEQGRQLGGASPLHNWIEVK
jgi:hypothetical protein